MNRTLPIILLLSLPMSAGVARAQSGPVGFQSPSKNIACQYFDYDRQITLRCDIAQSETRPRRPADCDLEYGHAFEMRAKGEATRICYGDTIIDATLSVLTYGEVWQRGGFTCKSEPTGITCFNTDRHGFLISRGKQDLF